MATRTKNGLRGKNILKKTKNNNNKIMVCVGILAVVRGCQSCFVLCNSRDIPDGTVESMEG